MFLCGRKIRLSVDAYIILRILVSISIQETPGDRTKRSDGGQCPHQPKRDRHSWRDH